MELYKDVNVPPELAAKYESEAGRYWDLFYKRNEDRFFKDRHYFGREWPQLLSAQHVLEVGCGVGNSIYPLLQLNPGVHVYACDFAPSAVALVRAHPGFSSRRVTAFVADITQAGHLAAVPPASVDVATMIFVLSAIAPDAMPCALRSVAATLRPGGQLLFRDYAAGDLCQDRLAGEGRQQRLSDSFYVRWDGTCAFYFGEEGLRRLFEAEGFRCEGVQYVDRVQENRKRGERLERRFIQAVFTFVGGGSSGGDTANGSSAGGAAEQRQQQQQQQRKEEQPQQQRQERQDLQEWRLQLGGAPLSLLCRPPPGSEAAAAGDCAASAALATVALRCPQLLHAADVLELCCREAALAALAALRWCRRAVAAGSCAMDMPLLRRNALRNSHLFVFERLRVAPLAWQWQGSTSEKERGEAAAADELEQQQQLMSRACPDGFGVVLAAPHAAAAPADLQRLLACVAAMLSRQGRAVALLCAADVAPLQAAAAAAGLSEARMDGEVAGAAAAAAAEAGTPLRFICLQHGAYSN
ncbi:S-adenosyl-L-methionine-dependent methyltransferases superfamily [Micractinium conductrix]|uniref:S-adenosyl-L-methionine-dependent methyltransferases superfamily n=1 Tax=Micractinium conductrix TaxID=554055 RepID=A0A2P6VLN7_9CHLO|nr:S-adenosyl-L-methionine-dependent methyltransferases superfamily [Micractinium conductrix]|eukprot:PSC75016.1 S-adenosyl-L-methionine-dependent methyltransferases superfamily [Micractinium conductrix]